MLEAALRCFSLPLASAGLLPRPPALLSPPTVLRTPRPPPDDPRRLLVGPRCMRELSVPANVAETRTGWKLRPKRARRKQLSGVRLG